MPIQVVISHAHDDEALATRFVGLLRCALPALAGAIRCTSVDGHGLEAGAHTSTELRAELRAARVVVGLLTPHAAQRGWVLFELGAAWGAGVHVIPVVAAGLQLADAPGPLKEVQAVDGANENAVSRMLESIATRTGVLLAGIAAYKVEFQQFVEAASELEDDDD
ncbi:MAG: toll/interleukin-1 receptor domain-containing protein, partial [Deltaproteobacteria bacterium]|nr:toll/interleukin-1 receptor domain-containing protein [Deltaproteobacteria bacterium]